MTDIDYPCRLPGFLVNGNSYRPKSRVRRNELHSGPPIYVLEDDSGYVSFQVLSSFSAVEMQVFRNFFRHTIASGSKSFNVELMVEGFDGAKNTVTHQCYFDEGVYDARQNGRRWRMTATLISIDEKTLNECEGESLVNFHGGIDYNINKAVVDFNDIGDAFDCFFVPTDQCDRAWVIGFESGLCYESEKAINDFQGVSDALDCFFTTSDKFYSGFEAGVCYDLLKAVDDFESLSLKLEELWPL